MSPANIALASLNCVRLRACSGGQGCAALMRFFRTLVPSIGEKLLSIIDGRVGDITDALLESCGDWIIQGIAARRQSGEPTLGVDARLVWRVYAAHDAAGGSDGADKCALAIALSTLPDEGPSAVRMDTQMSERILSNAARVLGHVLQVDAETRTTVLRAVVTARGGANGSGSSNRMIAAFKAVTILLHTASNLMRGSRVCVDLVLIWRAIRMVDARWLDVVAPPSPFVIPLHMIPIVQDDILAGMLDAGFLELVVCETTTKAFVDARELRTSVAWALQLKEQSSCPPVTSKRRFARCTIAYPTSIRCTSVAFRPSHHLRCVA